MPRHANLRKKKVGKSEYWYTEAGGGSPTYFGNVSDTPFIEAKRLFSEHMKSLAEGTKSRNILTCATLIDQFLEWIQVHRSDRTYDRRKRDLNRFGNFRVAGGQQIGNLPANKVKGSDLESWLKHLKAELKLAAQSLRHCDTSIRHCWSWATKYPSPTPLLPSTFRPFSSVEKPYVQPKVLTEDDLITEQEIQSLFKAAEADLDLMNPLYAKVKRDHNPYAQFADMLRCYYATGARTGELERAEVADFQAMTNQLVLGNHKTSRTQRDPRPRYVTLNSEAVKIVARLSQGKSKTDRLFTTSDGKPWKRRSLPDRFVTIKEIANGSKLGKVRDHITLYSFRHLWISEAMMAGNDVATVARMAGTSIAMIERTYGHFRNDHLHEAQARLDAMREERRSQSK